MNNKINNVVDILDECAMLLYEDGSDPELEDTAVMNYRVEKPHTNYFECILSIYNFFLDEKYHLDVKNDDTYDVINEKLEKLEDLINTEGFTYDELRRALLMLDIKAFKNVNFSLDLITPDTVGIICAKLCSILSKDKKKINILDPNVGTGNLVFSTCAQLKQDVNLIGIDSHELMCRLVCQKANMLQQDMSVYMEDALSYICHDVDIVISDPATYDYINSNYKSELYTSGITYFPYLLIEHLLNMDEGTNYLMVVDADFFNKNGADKLKNMPNFNVKAFVCLPEDMFLDGVIKKGILIFDNKEHDGKVDFFILPSIKKQEDFLKVFKEIEKTLQK